MKYNFCLTIVILSLLVGQPQASTALESTAAIPPQIVSDIHNDESLIYHGCGDTGREDMDIFRDAEAVSTWLRQQKCVENAVNTTFNHLPTEQQQDVIEALTESFGAAFYRAFTTDSLTFKKSQFSLNTLTTLSALPTETMRHAVDRKLTEARSAIEAHPDFKSNNPWIVKGRGGRPDIDLAANTTSRSFCYTALIDALKAKTCSLIYASQQLTRTAQETAESTDITNPDAITYMDQKELRRNTLQDILAAEWGHESKLIERYGAALQTARSNNKRVFQNRIKARTELYAAVAQARREAEAAELTEPDLSKLQWGEASNLASQEPTNYKKAPNFDAEKTLRLLGAPDNKDEILAKFKKEIIELRNKDLLITRCKEEQAAREQARQDQEARERAARAKAAQEQAAQERARQDQEARERAARAKAAEEQAAREQARRDQEAQDKADQAARDKAARDAAAAALLSEPQPADAEEESDSDDDDNEELPLPDAPLDAPALPATPPAHVESEPTATGDSSPTISVKAPATPTRQAPTVTVSATTPKTAMAAGKAPTVKPLTPEKQSHKDKVIAFMKTHKNSLFIGTVTGGLALTALTLYLWLDYQENKKRKTRKKSLWYRMKRGVGLAS